MKEPVQLDFRLSQSALRTFDISTDRYREKERANPITINDSLISIYNYVTNGNIHF
jgi:hypothetical protein